MFGKFKKSQLSDLVKLSGVYIGPGIIAEGEIKTEDDVFIDCEFKGSVITDGVIEMGKNSIFAGGLEGRSILFEGMAKAEAKAIELISFANCAEFQGTSDSREIIVAKGAIINGKITTQKS